MSNTTNDWFTGYRLPVMVIVLHTWSLITVGAVVRPGAAATKKQKGTSITWLPEASSSDSYSEPQFDIPHSKDGRLD